jgi:predicted nucleic acid-binding protein
VLVVDASVAVVACLASDGFEPLAAEPLAAPPLLWPEGRSALHVMAHRGEVSGDSARAAAQRLTKAPIALRAPARLGGEAWRIADELGWARTYDAEYLALARILDCRVVTLDARLRRGADRLGLVVAPSEL